MVTVPHRWADRNRFPNEAEWPWIFISDVEARSDDLPVPYWNEPPAGRYLPSLLCKLQTAPDREQVLIACQAYAVQAAHHSDNPGNDTVQFAGWICARYGLAESRPGLHYGADLELGREIRPEAAFLVALCHSKPWDDAGNALLGRRTNEQLSQPMPPELRPFFKPPDPPQEPKPEEPPAPPKQLRLRPRRGAYKPVDVSTFEERADRRQEELRPLMAAVEFASVLELATACPAPTSVRAVYDYWNGVTKKPRQHLLLALANALQVDVRQIPV
jgi:hypothetical protein